MARIVLTAKLIERLAKSPPALPLGGRRGHADALVPGLSARVTAKGHVSFILVARYPSHPRNPSRRRLGDYGEITLEQARERAREWLALIQRGIDRAPR